MMRRWMGSVALPLLLLTGTAQAQDASVPATAYRQGLPPVLTPPSAPSGVSAGDFAGAYRKAGRPRIVVFWNRELSDEVATPYVDRVIGRTDTVIGSAAIGGAWSSSPYDIAGFSAGAAVGHSTTDILSGRIRVDPAARPGLAEADQWAFEQAIVQALGAAGVRLIDRAVVMRLAAGNARQSPNVQAIEAAAIRSKADILLEILATRAADAPLGWAFRGNAKSLRNGEILATVTTTGAAEAGAPTHYRTTDNGFQPIVQQPTYDAAARQLARSLMAALTARWR